MPDGSDGFVATTNPQIADIDGALWDQLANSDPATRNPFVSYAFLKALETSGSASAQTGWAPAHVTIFEKEEIVAVAPLYAKGHSQGEYVFDHHWADAYARAGGNYYPKLLSAVPFTPVNAPKLFTRDQSSLNALCSAMIQLAAQSQFSSVHVNFTTETDHNALALNGFLTRKGEQFHWFNREYSSFDDFLNALSSRKRKMIRRERRGAIEDGLKIRRLRGAEITEEYWDAFWAFYQDTGARKWGRPYLTRAFFSTIAETMPDDLLLIVAEENGRPVAGALNIIGGDALYGRYWGCLEDRPFLHFEICYYQAIEVAIEEKLARVEAGAQGEHKIARGYEPVATQSAHWLVDANFRQAISDYLEREGEKMDEEIEFLSRFTPFKKGQGTP